MTSSRVATQQVVAELIGSKTYRPLISLRLAEQQADESREAPIVEAFAIYRKSLQVIPSGPYTLRFAIDGISREYSVRVANKTLLPTEDEEQKAA